MQKVVQQEPRYPCHDIPELRFNPCYDVALLTQKIDAQTPPNRQNTNGELHEILDDRTNERNIGH